MEPLHSEFFFPKNVDIFLWSKLSAIISRNCTFLHILDHYTSWTNFFTIHNVNEENFKRITNLQFALRLKVYIVRKKPYELYRTMYVCQKRYYIFFRTKYYALYNLLTTLLRTLQFHEFFFRQNFPERTKRPPYPTRGLGSR